MKRSMVGFLASFLSLLLTLCCAKIHIVSPLGDFPTDPTTQTWVQSTDLASALSAASNNDVFYLCDGEEFEGPFTLTKNGCNLQSYPCTPSKAGIKPQLTVSKTFQGTPAVDPTSGQWTYDLSSYAQYFDAVPVIAALWINGTRYHPARYPNLVDPANPVGQSTSEFVYATPLDAGTKVLQVNSVKPATTLKNIQSQYWVGATMRIRETDSGYTSWTVSSVAKGELILSTVFTNAGMLSGSGFFLEQNVLAELDAPGEYFWDSAAHKLHVLPMAGHLPSFEMRFLPQSAALQTAGGGVGAALYITSSGASLTGIALRFGFVGIQGAASLQSVEVRDMINTGVSGNLNLAGCTFSDIGVVGAYLQPGSLPLTVQSSSFSNVGLWAGYSVQPTGVQCHGLCTVQGNTFSGMGYAAVWPNRDSSVVTGNVMSKVMLGLSDGGAVYSGKNLLVLTDNTIVDIVGNTLSSQSDHAQRISTAFYLDSGASGGTLAGNTILTGYVTPDVGQSCFKMDNANNVTGNVCVGGSLDVLISTAVVLTGMVVDNNIFMPTPGTPGEDVPVLFRFGQPVLSPPYLPTHASFQSIAGNTFCKTAPGTSAASWVPFYIGYDAPLFAGTRNTPDDLGIAHFADVSNNFKDTSGKCLSHKVPTAPTTGLARKMAARVLRKLVRGAVRGALRKIHRLSAFGASSLRYPRSGRNGPGTREGGDE